MQGISASLEHSSQFTTQSSSIPAPHDGRQALPSQPQPGVHAAQQASRGSSDPALSPTESVQPEAFAGIVVGHSPGWQGPSDDRSSRAGVQVGSSMSKRVCHVTITLCDAHT